MPTSQRRTYDHRLKQLVCRQGSARLLPRSLVPRTTALTWIRRGCPKVVTVDGVSNDPLDLQAEVLDLRRRCAILVGILKLLLVLVRLRGARLTEDRLPDGAAKRNVLDALSRVKDVLPLRASLRIVGLSPSRFHSGTGPRGVAGSTTAPLAPKPALPS